MPRNTLNDLNNHLFEQIERISDDELTEEQFEREVQRSRTISSLAKGVVNNARVMLDAQKHRDEYYGSSTREEIPEILKIGNK